METPKTIAIDDVLVAIILVIDTFGGERAQ
jgi:hypothetical protein